MGGNLAHWAKVLGWCSPNDETKSGRHFLGVRMARTQVLKKALGFSDFRDVRRARYVAFTDRPLQRLLAGPHNVGLDAGNGHGMGRAISNTASAPNPRSTSNILQAIRDSGVESEFQRTPSAARSDAFDGRDDRPADHTVASLGGINLRAERSPGRRERHDGRVCNRPKAPIRGQIAPTAPNAVKSSAFTPYNRLCIARPTR